MDRSYIEYSRIVESFISEGGDKLTQSSLATDQGGPRQEESHTFDAQAHDLDRRIKLAFINVLREEMTD